MRTYNLNFEGYDEFKRFISHNQISNKADVLVQIFSGKDQTDYIENVISSIVALIPQAKIIGATTDGEILNGKILKNQCLISISVFEKTTVKTCFIKDNLSDFAKGVAVAQKLLTPDTKVIIAFADVSVDGQDFLDGINSINPEVIVSGGIAGKSKIADSTYVFTENGLRQDAIVAVSLESRDLLIYNQSSFNWIPIGREHVVTEAEGRIIRSIENIPAQEFYSKYIQPNSSEEIERTREQFPLLLKKKNSYVGRPVLSFLNDGEILISSRIPSGEKIRIGFGDLSNVLRGSLEVFETLTQYPGESLFIYSCSARKNFLKKMALNELSPLGEDSNASGFYTYGEFNNVDQENTFYTETMTLLLLSEDPLARIKIAQADSQRDDCHFEDYTTLYNFIKTTGEELHQLNLSLEEMVDQKTKELKKQYQTDELTGLENRSKLLIDLAEGKYDKLAIIDIKSFNGINDFYGNSIGDAVLKDLSKLIGLYCTKNNLTPYRVNSDIFAVVDSQKSNEGFIDTVHHLQNVIHNERFFYEEGKIYLAVTLGLALREESLFEKAEMALHSAKKSRKLFQIYKETLNTYNEIKENIIWTKKIKEAITDDRIIPFFQPIVSNSTGMTDKYEALIRMIGDEGEVISPYFFLEIAKKAGLYRELTVTMLEKTFEVLNRTDYEISINLLLQDIESQEIRELIMDKLENIKNPKNVVFEIVESEGIEDFEEVLEFIREVKKYGSKIAIDDFGTGYSNFSYLMKLNADYIKIDGSIIKNIQRDKSAEVLTKTIVAFAKEMGIETVAEFVSDEEIYKRIKELGIDYSQGYYFSEPKKTI